MLGKGKSLPDDDHVMRYVPWAKLRKDEDENVLGFLPQAFELRPNEESLSVNWLEYFEGDHQDKIRESVREFRKRIKPGKKSAFGIAKVSTIKKTCSSSGTLVKIVYEPGKDNPSHAAIRSRIGDDLALLQALADDFYSAVVFNSRIS